MRQPNTSKSDEHVTTLSAAAPVEIAMGKEVFNDGELAGDATLKNPVRVVNVAPPKRYRVANDKPIGVQDDGFRAQLFPGKEISDAHYDIRKLQKQGVRLIEIDENGVPVQP